MKWQLLSTHLCSNFSIRRQMAPVLSIKFQTANFPIFCARIIVIFWTTCIARETFFCYDNGQCDAHPASPQCDAHPTVRSSLPNFTLIDATCRPCGAKNPKIDSWVKTIPAELPAADPACGRSKSWPLTTLLSQQKQRDNSSKTLGRKRYIVYSV